MKPFQTDRFPTVIDHFMHTGEQLFATLHKDYFYGPIIRMREANRPTTLVEILTDTLVENPDAEIFIGV